MSSHQDRHQDYPDDSPGATVEWADTLRQMNREMMTVPTAAEHLRITENLLRAKDNALAAIASTTPTETVTVRRDDLAELLAWSEPDERFWTEGDRRLRAAMDR